MSRYASVFSGVEINSTFYKRHKPQTFERWRDSVPSDFRFSVKLPKHMTHDLKFQDVQAVFGEFLGGIEPLIPKLGPLLCQLPPSLAFGNPGIGDGLRSMRDTFAGAIVIEPRHVSWDCDDAISLLDELSIGRVLADPAPVWAKSAFDGKAGYVRLHGKPKIYYSAYTDDEIAGFAGMLAQDSWCIFDNTASGAAIENALSLLDQSGGR